MSAKKRLKKKAQNPLPADWTVSTEFTSPSGRILTPGVEVSIRGERAARFRFLKHVRKDDGSEWIDVIGGPKGVNSWRSFRPERIKRVHRTRKTMTASEARDLVNSKNRQKREEREPRKEAIS